MNEEVSYTGYDKYNYDLIFTGICPLTPEGALTIIHEKSLKCAVIVPGDREYLEDLMEYEADIIQSNTLKEHELKELLEEYDDLDYIYFNYKNEVYVYLIKYLQSKGYKICMPIGDKPELIKILQQDNITLQCENRYNAQQKLNI